MSTFSDEMAAVALELITEFGEAVTFTRTTEGAYNSATGTTASATTSNFAGVAVPQNYDSEEIDGTNILQSDLRLITNAVATRPEPQDQVSIDSVLYRVINVSRITVNSNDVAYELQVRV